MSNIASADIAQLADALRQSAQNSEVTTHEVLVSSANYIKSDMESRVPVRTGRLKQSIAIKVETDRVIIGPNTDYAWYVEHGTGPHVIEAKKGKALAWRGSNGMVYAKRVNHPGTKPNPFVRPAFEDWVDGLGEMAAAANIQELEKS